MQLNQTPTHGEYFWVQNNVLWLKGLILKSALLLSLHYHCDTHLQLQFLRLFIRQRDDSYFGDLVDFVVAW